MHREQQKRSILNVRGKLEQLITSKSTVHDDKSEILDGLVDLLQQLKAKGTSYAELAEVLGESNIEISAVEIQEYLQEDQAKRIALCEQILARNYANESENAFRRVARIEHGLRQSLKSGRDFELKYQPQIDTFTGQVIGAEALIRWEFEGTQVPPTEFISIAERSDLIVQLGEWVLREASREAKYWHSLGLGGDTGIKLGVNLSVRQFTPDLPNLLHEILCTHNLPPRLIGLEITESFLMANEALPILHTLHDSGIHLSIDDFGTGYSCMAQLKDMPIDTIKIDRSFVEKLGLASTSDVMVNTIMDMAKKLKMNTLAEGVEAENQIKILKNMGCSVFQGYFYAPALSSNYFVRFVDRGLDSNH